MLRIVVEVKLSLEIIHTGVPNFSHLGYAIEVTSTDILISVQYSTSMNTEPNEQAAA